MKAATTFFRHRVPRYRTLMCVVPALCGLGYSLAAAATLLPEELIGAAEGFLEFSIEDYLQRSEIQARYEIEINRLDPRLRLPRCDRDLDIVLESPAQPIGRVTLRVRCEGSSPWSVFVPGQVRLYREVVVLSRPLKRDSILSAADLSLLEREVGLLGQGYLTDVEQARGRKLTRSLNADQVVSSTHLQLAEAVRKGDQVVISARSGNIQVRMPGEALSNGVLGEQIQVRNQGSQRVIKARITGPGQVEVAM